MASAMNVGLPTLFPRGLVYIADRIFRKRRKNNHLIRLGMTAKTAGERGGRQDRLRALAWTPTSYMISAILMPLKLCSFIYVT